MQHAFFDQLDPCTVIFTVNNRLARYLQTTYDEHQQANHKQVWQTPFIWSLQTWLEKQFHETNRKGQYLLNDFQERYAWELIIKQTKLTNTIPLTALAKLAQQAFEYLTLWQVPLDALKLHAMQLETRCFIDWVMQFQRQNHEKKWITGVELFSHVKIHCHMLQLPKKIRLMGFDDINPSLQELFAILKNGCDIRYESLQIEATEKTQVVLEDARCELQAMAQFAKSQLEKNPRAKIGCIVPDLRNKRSLVYRTFIDVFDMEYLLPHAEKKPLPFNLSVGIALNTHPMIKTALMILNWCHSPLPIEHTYAILQSDYLYNNEDEKNDGALCDALLREQNLLEVNITDLLFVSSKLQLNSHAWLLRWRTMLEQYRKTSRLPLKPSQWIQHFILLLKCSGWPSQKTQSSEAFQVLERFKKLCQEFSMMDFMMTSLSYREALSLFAKLIENTLFQAKSHHEPIQILGLLEGSNILFDVLWVAGVNDHTWPPAAKPNPFIPHAIQQRYQLPHATAKHELTFYQNMTERLKNNAKQVIFSSIAQEGDQHLSPSRLIHDVSAREIYFSSESLLTETLFLSKKMDAVDDTQASPLSDFSTLRGGTMILSLQALCPFRAFASIRLKARAFQSPALGISAKTKGILMHQLLYELWGKFENQAALKTISETALQTVIQTYIDKVFSDRCTLQENQNTFFSRIEKKRLTKMITEWLAIEKSRPDFTVYLREHEERIQVGKLPLQIRIDRVDQLSDGSLLLIDYKTNTNTIQNWFQARLTEPQLPLYAVFHDQSLSSYQGITFAEIKTDCITFRGVINENHIYRDHTEFDLLPINKIKNNVGITTWSELLDHWKKSLIQLSNDFCHGIAVVDPMKPTVCQTCDLQSLCRYRLSDEEENAQ